MHAVVRILLPLGVALACAACDDPPVAVPLDAAPEPPDVTPDPDMSPPPPRKAAGEVCEPGQCARGSCVNGVCSALCARDADCEAATPLCVGRGGAGRCSAACASAADCAAGLVCAVVGVDVGICVAPGAGLLGDACAAREDCASWFCADGRCAGACDPEPCPAGRRCLPLHTQSVCIPVGEASAEAPCGDGLDCASGVCRGGRCADVCPEGRCDDDRVCLRYPAANLCERRCADSGDCGETGRCLLVGDQRLCITRGVVADGDPCAAHADCASGRCDLGRCSAPCDGGCPAGTACVTDITGSACRPAGPAAVGARCEAGPICETAVCGAGECSADCADGACPEGTRCAAFADGAFCFPGCADDDDCPSVAFCDARFEAGPICFWRGAAGTGVACDDHRDCASGRCAAGRCLGACTAECPAGLRCVSVGRGRFCTARPLPEEAACDAADGCADGLACTAGRCLPTCDGGCPPSAVCRGGVCHPRCGDDLDCRAGRICDRLAGACIDPGPGGDDAPCTDAADCAAGLCLDGRCPARCGAACAAGVCAALGRDRLCLAVGEAVVGAVCAAHGECASGLCLGRRCAGPCADGCPEGTACVERFGGRWCIGACGPEAPCDADEVCDPVDDPLGGQCVAAPAEPVIGAGCTDEVDCGPGAAACLDGLDGRRCRAACRVALDDCPAGETCAPLAAPVGDDPAPGACVPVGVGGPLDPCGEGGECGSGWCITGYLDGRCGAPCRVDPDCAEGRCVDLARDPAAPLRVCAARCSTDLECPDPLRCRRDATGDGACY